MMMAVLLGRLLVLGGLAALTYAQTYPFAVDQDAISGVVDFGSLNAPLTEADRVFVREGHFYRVGPDASANTVDDQRVRLFGVNLAFSANFPTAGDAVRIAKRLRRLGVNVVRLHHMDTQPDRSPANAGSVLTDGPYPTFNPVAIERLRTFLDALKAEGIYANLNLHVGYLFRPSVDGVPALPSFPTQTKPLRLFYPPMVQREQQFTRELIAKLALAHDPVLAMVEISNETSLIYHWQAGSLDRYLTGDYGESLKSAWNQFLRDKYTDATTVAAAWGSSESDGDDILPGQWRSETRGTPVTLTRDGDELRIDSPQVSTPVIIKQVGFSVEAGRSYVAEIEMRAELASGTRNIYWDVKQDVSPWRTVTGQTVQVGADWRKFRMVVTPQFAMDGVGRFAISVENVGSPVIVRNWRLYSAGKRGWNTGEDPSEGAVELVWQSDVSTDARANDYLLFLSDRDRTYLNTMLAAVRETTDALVPVAGTQVGFGGLMNYDSHRDLDYQDNHFYVDHYNFPNTSWDGRDWRFHDQSNIASGATAFANMAIARQAGRPYTVSEFNQPWPNTYGAEMDPTLAVFARFQDWDGLMHFAYSHGRGWDDGVPNGFNLNGDWTKWVNFGQAAWLFRSGAIREGTNPVTIPVPDDLRLRATREKRNGNINAFLAGVYGYDSATAFAHPVRLATESTDVPEEVAAKRARLVEADSGEFTYDRDAKVWTIHATSAAGVFGQLEGSVNAGAIEVTRGDSARPAIALLVTSLDGEPLDRSARMLLTNPGYSLRTQPSSTPARPQTIVNYPGTTDWRTLEADPRYPAKPSGDLNGGNSPTYMERVEVRVLLRTSASQVRVYPLDGKGARLRALDVPFLERTSDGFRIWLQAEGQDFAPWYEIEADL